MLADVARAAQLNPSDPLFTSSAAYVQAATLPPLANRERVQFAPGATSAALNLNLTPSVPRGYVLRVLAQQKMPITIPATVDVVVLNPQDDGSEFGAKRGESLNVIVPITGDSTVVFTEQGTATFRPKRRTS